MDSEKKFPKVSDDKNKQRSRSLQINEIERLWARLKFFFA